MNRTYIIAFYAAFGLRTNVHGCFMHKGSLIPGQMPNQPIGYGNVGRKSSSLVVENTALAVAIALSGRWWR
jgi:hypothetical protein